MILVDIALLKPSVLDFTAQVFQLLESILKQCQPDQLDESNILSACIFL